jgi:hypothetical protein
VTTVIPRTPNDAIKKAAAASDPVTQEIAWGVKGGKAEAGPGQELAGIEADPRRRRPRDRRKGRDAAPRGAGPFRVSNQMLT